MVGYVTAFSMKQEKRAKQEKKRADQF